MDLQRLAKKALPFVFFATLPFILLNMATPASIGLVATYGLFLLTLDHRS